MSERIFVTADTHFGHAAAIQQFARDFSDVTAMDAGLLAGINDVVGPDDVLYHLGDFVGPVEGCSKTSHAEVMRERIACKKIVLLRGNHDRVSAEAKPLNHIFWFLPLHVQRRRCVFPKVKNFFQGLVVVVAGQPENDIVEKVELQLCSILLLLQVLNDI